MYSRNAADAGAYCHRVVLSWALFPAMVATGTDRIFANLFWMGGDDLEKMKSGLSSQKGIAMLKILNDTTKKHRTKICLVLFGAPAGIRIPDTLIKRAHRAEHSDFRSFEFSLFFVQSIVIFRPAISAPFVVFCKSEYPLQPLKPCKNSAETVHLLWDK